MIFCKIHSRSLSVIDAWKKFTILDCVKHVGIAYVEIKESTLNACWKAVWPDVTERANPPILLEQEYSQIIELAHSLGGEGFEDLSEADIIEIMKDKEICENDLIDMVNITSENESDNETVAAKLFVRDLSKEENWSTIFNKMIRILTGLSDFNEI
ncbi:tigger transposable element-derived protein 1 [Nephila pilipes]|uniref:Tigger transposable element-derived protein 1 n=1 Tax=Nephila pilipes TaxID=299642 RepID=A0A8X6IEW7_NEPPI|nr:tigger transposable element-derived protein 1 [Nephila pilipes]